MTRSNAREIACHLVYEMNFNGITADEAMNLLMDPDYYPSLASETEIYAERPSGKQAEYLAGVVHGVEREREKLAGFIEKNTIGWSLLFLNVKICRSGSHTSTDFNKAAIIKYCFNP